MAGGGNWRERWLAAALAVLLGMDGATATAPPLAATALEEEEEEEEEEAAAVEVGGFRRKFRVPTPALPLLLPGSNRCLLFVTACISTNRPLSTSSGSSLMLELRFGTGGGWGVASAAAA